MPSDPKSWCKYISPCGDVQFEDFALDMPDDRTSGEVLANVHLIGEGTDITGRYELIESERGWMLAFSNFDVM